LKTHLLSLGLILAGLSGCGPSYSPDTYASSAVQQANKVEQGIVIGVRDVAVSASGTTGAVTGAAAGGIAGTAAEHIAADTNAYEYIVRKGNGDLVSVTQKDKTPLALGQHVLVIAGNQARVVPDYTVPPEVTQAKPEKAADPAKPPEAAKATEPGAPAESGKPTELAKPAEPSKPAEPEATPAAAPSADAKPAEAAPAASLPVKADEKPVSPAELVKSIGAALN
jgi:outer membrane lipoprotein SlyB